MHIINNAPERVVTLAITVQGGVIERERAYMHVCIRAYECKEPLRDSLCGVLGVWSGCEDGINDNGSRENCRPILLNGLFFESFLFTPDKMYPNK